eukprot:131289_1
MTEQWRSEKTYSKWSIDDLCKFLVPDFKQNKTLLTKWQDFGKKDKKSLINFVYKSPNNIKNASPQTIEIPTEFETLSIDTPKKPYGYQGRQSRYKNHIPSTLTRRDYNQTRRTPSLPIQHDLRDKRKIALTPMDGYGITDFKYVA